MKRLFLASVIALSAPALADGSLPALNWRYSEPGGDLFTAPAVSADGTIYLCSNTKLIAVAPDGTRKWEDDHLAGSVYNPSAPAAVAADYSAGKAPSIGPDGTVYYVSDRGYLYAYRPDGTRQWRTYLPVEGVTQTGIAIDGDGTLYVSGNNRTVFAVNPDGTVKWTYSHPSAEQGWDTLDSYSGAPVLDAAHRIHLVSGAGLIVTLNADGSEAGIFNTRGEVESGMAVSPDGTSFVHSNNTLFAVSADGGLSWSAPVPSHRTYGGLLTPVLGSDGTVYTATLGVVGDSPSLNEPSRVYAFSPSGALRWVSALDTALGAPTALSVGSGNPYAIYVSTPRSVEVLAAGGRTVASFKDAAARDNQFSFSRVVEDGRGALYLTTLAGNLYSLSPAAAGM